MPTPDSVVGHRPAQCRGCQAPLAVDALAVLRERRQIYELPLLRKQGQALLAALETLFAGQPLSPAFA